MRTLLLLALALPVAAAEPLFEKRAIFEAGTGEYAIYRIPALVCTEKGTLVAFCEARKSASGDWGAIDLLYRRSTDAGKTWSEPKKLDVGRGFEKNPVAVNLKLGAYPNITINNPTLIAGRGVVHLLYCVE